MKNRLFLLAFLLLLTAALLAACAPAQPSGDNPNTVQTTIDVPQLTPYYLIQSSNGNVYYEVVSFVDQFGRKCTSVLSVYSDAGPALFCQ